ncbi:OmpA family protein [uncultured Shimia sp.]|uniref:OmpA family protein n=1 Tax=uncultured Shimia sp. TaxID=573152 RepID=UPI0025E9F302|nr:OmpA family protein [uncultured Shimia sp.]
MCVFRFPHLLILVLLGVFDPSAATALNETELCARAVEQYGVEPTQCGLPSAGSPSSSPTALSNEVLESHIFFPQGGTSLNDDAQVQLAVLLSVLNTSVMQSACLRLIGHSDSSGGEDANKALALKRAETVAAALRDGLKDPSRIRTVGSAGEARPLSGLESTSVHNRRVEIQAKTCP